MPRCGCFEHGLEYLSFYVQKHIADLAACSGPPTGFWRAARGTRISETCLFPQSQFHFPSSAQIMQPWLEQQQRCRSTLAQVMAYCVITWTNADLSSVRSSYIQQGAISQETPQPSNTKINLKFTYLNLYSNLPGASELIDRMKSSLEHLISLMYQSKYWYILSG